ncbi:MAG: ABC transporter ATP-binding protein [Nocardioidaceae bacterium]
MTDGEQIVSVEALTRSFGRQRPPPPRPCRGVFDVGFEIGPGEVFGFLGPNGAGKSTTIRLLLGLYRPDGGRIRLFGLDPATDSVEVHRRTGYLPGELALYPRLTGRQLLDRFASARNIRGPGERRYRDELVERFEAELDRPLRTLSKGNRQKIGIVVAFMHRPELLVLDEPTSGLDPLLQDEFARLLRETADDGRSVLLSSHELDEVQRTVDRLSIIREGRIVDTDTVVGLRSRSPRTVELRFASPVATDAFDALSGVHVVSSEPERVVLSLVGPVAPLLRLAADLGAVDLTARPADLDELFLTYYRNQESDRDRSEARSPVA